MVLFFSFVGSHFTGVQLTWKSSGGLSVIFTIEVGFRHSWDAKNVGDTLTSGTFNYGDGTTASLVYTIAAVSLADDWMIGRATLSKTYASAINTGTSLPWIAYSKLTLAFCE